MAIYLTMQIISININIQLFSIQGDHTRKQQNEEKKKIRKTLSHETEIVKANNKQIVTKYTVDSSDGQLEENV